MTLLAPLENAHTVMRETKNIKLKNKYLFVAYSNKREDKVFQKKRQKAKRRHHHYHCWPIKKIKSTNKRCIVCCKSRVEEKRQEKEN